MGVFVLESSKQHDAFEFAKQHMLELLQNDKAKFSDLLDLFQTSSLSEFKRTIAQSEKEMQQRIEQQQQMEAQQQQQILQQQLTNQMQILDKEHENAMEIETLRAETTIKKAEIDVFKYQMDLDADNNGVPDPLEIEKLKAQIKMSADKLALEKDKLRQTKELKEKELEIKKKQANKPTSTKKS